MMADLKSVVNPILLAEEDLRRGIELLFFAYRDFTGEADRQLAELGLGRAHHRAIYFIGRNQGLTVSELLATLKITKQSLSRVLQELMAEDYVVQHPGQTDRRQRRLRLTSKGEALEQALTEGQRRRLARAYAQAGADAVDAFHKVLLHVIDDGDRPRLPESETRLSPVPETEARLAPVPENEARLPPLPETEVRLPPLRAAG
jgi:DNA-binding MarR family transcriptional regulator